MQIDDYEGRLWHPLITKAGRWLRRYGLDELRLFINTISEQLSLVKSALRVFSFERATGYRLLHRVLTGLSVREGNFSIMPRSALN